VVRRTEQILLTMRIGYAFHNLFITVHMPSQLENELKQVQRGEELIDLLNNLPADQIAGMMIKNIVTLTCMTLRGLATFVDDTMVYAIDTGRQLFSTHSNSYVFYPCAFVLWNEKTLIPGIYVFFESG
jgi:hypothetical protein